jgi:hypothetical protein
VKSTETTTPEEPSHSSNSVIPETSPPSQSRILSIEEIEQQYLENEENRIKEHKEALLRGLQGE